MPRAMNFGNERLLLQASRFLGTSVDHLRRFTRAELETLIEDRRDEIENDRLFWHRKFAELFVVLVSSNGFRKKGARLPKVEDYMPSHTKRHTGATVRVDDGFVGWLRQGI